MDTSWYWIFCVVVRPCRTSSPDVEKNVAQFFHDRDGNEHGVPVTVIGVNIEEDNPDRTDQFVKDSGMSLVADDLSEVGIQTLQRTKCYSAICNSKWSVG